MDEQREYLLSLPISCVTYAWSTHRGMCLHITPPDSNVTYEIEIITE